MQQTPRLSGAHAQQAKVISTAQRLVSTDLQMRQEDFTPRIQPCPANMLSPRVAKVISTSVPAGDAPQVLRQASPPITYCAEPAPVVYSVMTSQPASKAPVAAPNTDTKARSAGPSAAQGYDFTKSTEDNYCVPHFVGDHADIRPLLDHTFHAMYHNSRVEMQDQLVEQFLGTAKDQGNELIPWVIFTAGAMGAGKGYIRDWMQAQGFLPVERFVVVDPDAIRQALPEWEDYAKNDPEKAGDHTQKEAGMIAEVLGYRALRDRLNVVFDGSLRNASWYKLYFQKLRHNFPGIRIMILHIVADREDTLKRAEERGRKTGRYVPRQTLVDSMEAVPKSIAELAPFADFVCRILNLPGQEPQVVREPGAPFPHEGIQVNWDLMRTLWEDLDPNHDGTLSAEELQAALQAGIITQAVINSIDADNDGQISKEEILEAQKAARAAGSMAWH